MSDADLIATLVTALAIARGESEAVVRQRFGVAANSGVADPNHVRSAVSTWLTLALDAASNGPTTDDLLDLRDWIDNACVGDMPEPDSP